MKPRMVADDGRREVARRLRECRGGWSSGECYYTIIHALGLSDTSREDGGAALYAHLADLIEPSEPKVKCVAEVKFDGERLEQLAYDAAVELTGIDRDALLALADDIDKQTDGGMFDTWLEDGHYIARRIREACGEEVRNG